MRVPPEPRVSISFPKNVQSANVMQSLAVIIIFKKRVGEEAALFANQNSN